MKTQQHSTNKYGRFFAIFAEMQSLGFKGDRTDLLWEFSRGKFTSLTELSSFKYTEFINWTSSKLAKLRSERTESETKKKRKVIALFRQMGYVIADNKADMVRINEWCCSYGHLKTHLNGYSGEDLTKLVNQAESVYKSFIKAL